MRAHGSGRILQVTSEGGVRAFPQFGAYHASKWALEGLSQSLAQEVAAFGIRITMIEPGPYATDWGSDSLRESPHNPAYDEVRSRLHGSFERGTPSATRTAILEVADAEDPPLRIFFGRSFEAVEGEYQDRLATWRRWQPVALAAFGETRGYSERLR